MLSSSAVGFNAPWIERRTCFASMTENRSFSIDLTISLPTRQALPKGLPPRSGSRAGKGSRKSRLASVALRLSESICHSLELVLLIFCRPIVYIKPT
jgi:hypothetical protein